MIAVLDAFLNLDSSKQSRILNAAYREFARHGYAQASTNRIVQEAGIGKGMLFYYFNSKRELFNYLVEHGIDYMIANYLNRIDDGETDFVERCRQASQLKMKVYSENPHLMNFLAATHLNNEHRLPDKLAERLVRTQEQAYAKLFHNIDTSVFRDDVAPERVIKIIQWSLDGYTGEIINSLRGRNLSSVDYDPYWEDFHEYLEALKRAFYKPVEEGAT